MGNTQTIPAKSFDASRLPSGLTTAENAVIFNIGACDASCFGPGAVVTFTLNAAGAQQTGQTASVCNVGNSSMVAKGFTFALDKSALESAVLTVQVASGAQVLATTNIPVKKFKYSGKKYFTETVSFGMLQGKDKNTHMVPTLKLHRRSQLQHLSVRAAHRDVGTGYFEYFDVRGAFEEGHGRRLRLARAARRAVLRTISSLENTQCVALGCDDVTVDLLLLRLSENTFCCKRTHSIVREHIL